MDRKSEVSARRAVLKAGVAALAAGTASTILGRSAEAQQHKIAQKAVMYQATPKNNLQCSGCASWEPPNGCKIVDGTIDPNGWCVAFSPKKA